MKTPDWVSQKVRTFRKGSILKTAGATLTHQLVNWQHLHLNVLSVSLCTNTIKGNSRFVDFLDLLVKIITMNWHCTVFQKVFEIQYISQWRMSTYNIKFPFLSGISEINQLFLNMLMTWPAAVSATGLFCCNVCFQSRGETTWINVQSKGCFWKYRYNSLCQVAFCYPPMFTAPLPFPQKQKKYLTPGGSINTPVQQSQTVSHQTLWALTAINISSLFHLFCQAAVALVSPQCFETRLPKVCSWLKFYPADYRVGIAST